MDKDEKKGADTEFCIWGDHEAEKVGVLDFAGSDKRLTICEECFKKSLVYTIWPR